MILRSVWSFHYPESISSLFKSHEKKFFENSEISSKGQGTANSQSGFVEAILRNHGGFLLAFIVTITRDNNHSQMTSAHWFIS